MPTDVPPPAELWLLLTRYCAGECSAEESAELGQWIGEDRERRRWVESVWRLTERSALPMPMADSAASFARARARLGLDGREIAVGRDHTRQQLPSAPRGGRALRGPAMGINGRVTIAISLAAAACLVVAIAITGRRTVHHAEVREYATGRGQREIVTLADGTRITLAPGSHIRLDPTFGARTRAVDLDGEALFAVVHDRSRPFQVRVGPAIIEDVGTQFDVRAYAEDLGVRVAVSEGRVSMARRGSIRAAQNSLAAGDVAILTDTNVAVAHHADVAALTSWSTGTLTFRSTPLPDAVADLSRWYGVTVRLGDDALRARHVDAVIDGGSIDAVLDALVAGLGARYDVREGTIYTLHLVPPTHP